MLEEKGKLDILKKVQQSSNVELHYIRQKEAKGLGHAVWCARNFIGDEPFAVLLGDDIVQVRRSLHETAYRAIRDNGKIGHRRADRQLRSDGSLRHRGPAREIRNVSIR